MNEDEFKATYLSLNSRVCPFEKVILSRQCDCSRAARIFIAERQAVGCDADAPQQQCLALLQLLRSNASFALKITSASSRLPHAKEMKLQAGGLHGLQRALQPDFATSARIDDIHGLINQAKITYGELADLPYSAIVQAIAAYQGRRRGGRRGE